MLPGNGVEAPAAFGFSGSTIGIRALALLTLCEKSPVRSAWVGMLRNWLAKFASWRVYSCEAKMKTLVLPVLKCFGMKTGPPKLQPTMLLHYRLLIRLVMLLKKSLELNSSCR